MRIELPRLIGLVLKVFTERWLNSKLYCEHCSNQLALFFHSGQDRFGICADLTDRIDLHSSSPEKPTRSRYQPNPTSTPESLSSLCKELRGLAQDVDRGRVWPEASIAACANSGVFRWFIPAQYGGWNWSESDILRGYLALSQSCLTTTFVLTQWHAACRRILSTSNVALRDRLAPQLATGEVYATVGISHLTTSRQHLSQPVLKATRTPEGFVLKGSSPWVTGACAADLLVLGATLDDASQILVAVPTDRGGVIRRPGLDLLALTASCTGPVELEDVRVSHDEVLAGPVRNVMQSTAGGGGSSGGLQTSLLAIGLVGSAVDYMLEQSRNRESLRPVVLKLQSEFVQLRNSLEQLTAGESVCTAGELRRQANSLVLRATQSALQTAKGAGFVEGHPAGRWAREALFFLVWSCPQEVMEANLCEFAGLEAAIPLT